MFSDGGSYTGPDVSTGLDDPTCSLLEAPVHHVGGGAGPQVEPLKGVPWSVEGRVQAH